MRTDRRLTVYWCIQRGGCSDHTPSDRIPPPTRHALTPTPLPDTPPLGRHPSDQTPRMDRMSPDCENIAFRRSVTNITLFFLTALYCCHKKGSMDVCFKSQRRWAEPLNFGTTLIIYYRQVDTYYTNITQRHQIKN